MGLFACCREIYRSHVHCGLVGPTKEAAVDYFTKKLRAERFPETEAKKLLEDDLKTKSEQILAVEELKEAYFGK